MGATTGTRSSFQLASGQPIVAASESPGFHEATARPDHVGVELDPLLQIILMHRSVWNRASVSRNLSFGTNARCSCARFV